MTDEQKAKLEDLKSKVAVANAELSRAQKILIEAQDAFDNARKEQVKASQEYNDYLQELAG